MAANIHEPQELGELVKLYRAKSWRLAVGIVLFLVIALITVFLAVGGNLTTDIFAVFILLGAPCLYFLLRGWFVKGNYVGIYENGVAIVKQHSTNTVLAWDNIKSVDIERTSQNPLVYLISFWYLFLDLLLGSTQKIEYTFYISDGNVTSISSKEYRLQGFADDLWQAHKKGALKKLVER